VGSPDQALGAYLPALASAEPVPGGGSAAAVSAELGTALIGMVARITAASKRFLDVHFLAAHLAERADDLRVKLEAARLADEAAYARVAKALKLPKTAGDEAARRTEELQRALGEAAAAPLAIAGLSFETLALCERALELGNANLVSDLGCAALFGGAAVRAAALNVRVNHRYLHDSATVEAQSGELHALELAAGAASERILAETNRLLDLAAGG
jgi:formiminotetrahydrofolate cyclodeaminase